MISSWEKYVYETEMYSLATACFRKFFKSDSCSRIIQIFNATATKSTPSGEVFIPQSATVDDHRRTENHTDKIVPA